MSVLIRTGLIDDVEAIRKVALTDEDPSVSLSAEQLVERMQLFPHGYAVSELDGEIVGYMATCRMREFEYERLEHIPGWNLLHDPVGANLYVSSVIVHPKTRGRGLLKDLMRNRIEYAIGERMDFIQLVSIRSAEEMYPGKTRVHMYETLGFRAVREMESQHDGVCTLMQLGLANKGNNLAKS